MRQQIGPELTFNYDRDVDVLYISVGSPKPARAEHFDDDILLRYALDSDEIVGMTVLGFRALGGIDEVLRRLSMPALNAIADHKDELRKLVRA